MAKDKLIRSDTWLLAGDRHLRTATDLTIELYGAYVQRLCGLVLTHWPDIGRLTPDEQPLAVERLFNRTRANPEPRYARFFDSSPAFAKFPSYLRRAAIRAAVGQVSSFLTRYDRWQTHQRRKPTDRPPGFGKPNVHPVLYTANGGAGAMACFDGDVGRLKLWNGTDWVWFTVAVVRRGRRHAGPSAGLPQSPTLKVVEGRVMLTQPFVMPRYCRLGRREVVCSVDLGVDNRAVAAIVGSDGTVHRRAFFARSSHDDRRDKAAQALRSKARQTVGRASGRRALDPREAEVSAAIENRSTEAWERVLELALDPEMDPDRLGAVLGQARRRNRALVQQRRVLRSQVGRLGERTAGCLPKGFCVGLYGRIRGLNRQIATETAQAIIAFASANGATVIVFEQLKGWRPKAGMPGSVTKSKFHSWMHRALVRHVEARWVEQGGRVAFVSPWGTSAWAYDGSGKVVRPTGAHDLAIFATGKHYHADLNAAYNIGAKYWVLRLAEDPAVHPHLARLLGWEEKATTKERRAAAASNRTRTTSIPAIPARRKNGGAAPDRSVSQSRGLRTAPRAPATLSTLWRLAEAMQVETPTTAASAA